MERNDINLTGSQNIMFLAGVHYTYHPYLREKRETLYFETDNININTKYSYNDRYRLLKTTEVTDSRGDLLKNETFYPFEQNDDVYKTMTDNYMVAYPTGAISKRNNQTIAQSKTEYAEGLAINNANIILPYKEFFGTGNNEPEIISIYNEYDKIGNPLSITDYKSDDKICYLWSYAGSYPVAKIVGLNYAEVGQYGINIEQLWENQNPEQEDVEDIRNKLENTGALVTTYTYFPSIGMKTETDFRGITTYYKYDGLGRLKEIKAGKKDEPDSDENLLNIESYKYNYSTALLKIFSYSIEGTTITINYSGCSENVSSAELCYIFLPLEYNSEIIQPIPCSGTASITLPGVYLDYFDVKITIKITVKIDNNKEEVHEDSIYLYFDKFIND